MTNGLKGRRRSKLWGTNKCYATVQEIQFWLYNIVIFEAKKHNDKSISMLIEKYKNIVVFVAYCHKIYVKIKWNWNINLHWTKKPKRRKGLSGVHNATLFYLLLRCVSLSPSLLKWQKQDPIPNLTPKQQRNPPGLIILCLGSVLALLSYPLPLFLSFILSLLPSLSIASSLPSITSSSVSFSL